MITEQKMKDMIKAVRRSERSFAIRECITAVEYLRVRNIDSKPHRVILTAAIGEIQRISP